MSGVAQAAGWGAVSASALLLGAVVGWCFQVPQRLTAAVMAFGSGVLLSAVAFELIPGAIRAGGLVPTTAGLVLGAGGFTLANLVVERRGARHRKRSHGKQVTEQEHGGSGLMLAVGALLDGVPESILIGLSLLAGPAISLPTVVAIFLSNLPEGLSSAAGMKRAGRSAAYVMGVWGAVAATCTAAAALGFVAFADAGPATVAITTAIAAGAIICMLVDTMIPEAFAETHAFAGLITVGGFLAALALTELH